MASSTVGVFDGDRLVAYGEVGTGGRGDAAVDPAYRGRGIGTAIALWMQDNARGKGVTEIGMPVPQGSAGDRLLEALGYRVRWESWGLELPAGTTVPARELPDGYAVREADPSEYEAVLDRPGGRVPRVVGPRARDLRRTGWRRSPDVPASSRGTCASWSTPTAGWSASAGCS